LRFHLNVPILQEFKKNKFIIHAVETVQFPISHHAHKMQYQSPRNQRWPERWHFRSNRKCCV